MPNLARRSLLRGDEVGYGRDDLVGPLFVGVVSGPLHDPQARVALGNDMLGSLRWPA